MTTDNESLIKNIVARENDIITVTTRLAEAYINAVHESKVRSIPIPDFAIEIRSMILNLIELFKDEFDKDPRKNGIIKLLN